MIDFIYTLIHYDHYKIAPVVADIAIHTTLQEAVSAVNLFIGRKGQNKPLLNSNHNAVSTAQEKNIGKQQLPRHWRRPVRIGDDS